MPQDYVFNSILKVMSFIQHPAVLRLLLDWHALPGAVQTELVYSIVKHQKLILNFKQNVLQKYLQTTASGCSKHTHVHTVHNPSPNITFCILFWYLCVWSIFCHLCLVVCMCSSFFIDWRFFTENFNIFVRAHKQTNNNKCWDNTNKRGVNYYWKKYVFSTFQYFSIFQCLF